MREILFRGKISHGRGWAYGSLISADNYCCILESEEDVHPLDYPFLDNDLGTIDGQATPVDPETIGQYIGIKDKNGRKVFEGDIVITEFGRLCIVTWFSSRVHSGWDLASVLSIENCMKQPPLASSMWDSRNLEIVGNIYDNPELLKDDS